MNFPEAENLLPVQSKYLKVVFEHTFAYPEINVNILVSCYGHFHMSTEVEQCEKTSYV